MRNTFGCQTILSNSVQHVSEVWQRALLTAQSPFFPGKCNTIIELQIIESTTKLSYQNHGYMGEPIICLANIIQSCLIKQDFLQNESGHCLWQLRASLHDAQAQRNNFCCQQEINDLLLICLDQCPNHTQAGQSEIFEGARLWNRVKERVQVQRNVGQKKWWPCLWVRRYALEEGKSITHTIWLVCC